MVNAKSVAGAILLIVALYILIFMDVPINRFVAGGIFAVIGLAAIASGFTGDKKTPPTQTPPTQPQ